MYPKQVITVNFAIQSSAAHKVKKNRSITACPIFAVVLCILLCTALFSCRQLNVYEKNTSIAGHNWKSDVAAKGSFDIKDTAAFYNMYLVLRHTDAYQYENIWLNIGLQAPGDSMRYTRYNVQLANGAAGWEGTGMNDIWEIRKLLETSAGIFKKPGTWNFAVNQLMRDNPLPHIMSAGLRVEKQP
jgi:gliding motility-associated lipoprotein GldH